MNQIDKFGVDFEIWWNIKILRKEPQKILEILLKMFAKESPEQINYILTKFQKKKCSCCNGRGFLNEQNNCQEPKCDDV